MNFNHFYNTGSQPFKNFEFTNSNTISSLWTGNNLQNFNFSTKKKLFSTFNSFLNYSLGHFFSDSLNYSLHRIKEIINDLVLNPLSSSFDKSVSTSNFSFKKFLTIGVTTIILQLGATALQNTDNSENTIVKNNTYSSLQSDNYLSNLNSIPTSNSLNFSSFVKQSLSQSNPVESLKQDTFNNAVKIPKYMQSMFKTKEEAFLHLLNVAEGKQDKFYRDNKGIAIAYGWNPTRNSKEFNLKIAQESGFNEEQTAAIIRVSDTNKVNYVPKDLRKIKLSNEQLQKTAISLMPHYEEGFINAMTYHSLRHGRNPEKDIANYHDLPNNQQAVMIHMAYKVGGENLIHYKTFYKKLFSYLDKPNKSNLNQVQQNFQYTYANLDGTRLHDSRVEEIHTGFFSDCSIQANPKLKEKVSSKINQCRNIANLTDKDTVNDIKSNVASIQTKMSNIFT